MTLEQEDEAGGDDVCDGNREDDVYSEAELLVGENPQVAH